MKTKNFLNLKSWLLMMLMLIGVGGNAWADSYTITFKTGSGDGSAITTSTSISEIVSEGASYLSSIKSTVSKAYYNGSNGVKLGTSSAAGTLDFNLASKITPTSVVVNAKRYNTTKAATISLNDNDTKNLTSEFADYTFNFTHEIDHLKLVGSKYCWVKSITVFYEASGSDTPTKTDIATLNSISPTSLTVGDNGAFILDATFADGVVANEDYEISWESDNAEVLTLNGSSYEAKKAGKANVTVHVTVLDDETYNEVVRTFAVTVTKDLEGAGTEKNPYTVADVLYLFEVGLVPTDNVYVKGKVSEIKSLDTSRYPRAQYYISDNGETDNQFYVYNGKYLAGANFTANNQLEVGDEVVIYGKLTTYNAINEFAQDNYIVSNDHGDAVFSFGDETEFEVALNKPFTAPALSKGVYDGTVTYASSDTKVATVAEDGKVTLVGLGETTITASGVRTENYHTPIPASYALTVVAAVWTVEAVASEGGTVSLDGKVITATPNEGYRISKTNPYIVSGTAEVAQEGNVFTVTPASDCTVTINFEQIPSHSVVWSVNGTETTTTALEDAAVEFPAAPEAIEGKTFVGWVIAPIEGETDEAPTFVTSATMATSDLKYYAVFADAEEGEEETATLTANSSWSSYVEKTVTDDKGNDWTGLISGQNNSGVYHYGLNKTAHLSSPSFSGNIKEIKIVATNGSSKDRTFTFKDGETEVGTLLVSKNTTDKELSAVLNGTSFRQFTLTASDALQFTSIAVTYGGATYRGYCTTVDVPIRISNVEELKAFRDAVNGGNQFAGKTVKLAADLDLSGEEDWTPIGNLVAYPGQSFDGVFDGNGHTIKNVTVVDQTTPEHAVAGLFGSVVNGTIKNLTVENVNLTSSHYAGGIVAYTSNKPIIENCHVIGGTITSVPELINGSYDNGDKVGGIMGYATAGSTINNCTVDGLTIKAYRDMGGIVGFSAGNVTNNTVKNTTIIQSDVNAYKNEEITTYDYIVGRNGGATLENNVYEELNNVLTIDGAVAKIGDKLYRKLQAAVDAATEEDNVVTLLTDINLASDNVSINKAVTIKGEGHTIVSKATQAIAISGAGNVTIDNTVITSQNRGINVLNVTSGFTLNVENSTIQTNVEDPTTTYTTGENSRGINIANADGVTVNISNSTIQGYSYNINIPTSGKNLTVNMTGGKTYGRAAVNNWGSNNTITLDGVEVHGLNNQTGPTEAFACVVDNKGAQNNTFVLKDCQFTGTLSEAALTTEGSTASEHLLQLDGMNAIVKVLGSTTYSCNSDDKSRGGIFYTESYLNNNKLYFDDTTKQTFANAFELSVIADEKEAEVDLYPVNFAPEVFFGYVEEGKLKGDYNNFATPFEDGSLITGYYFMAMKDFSLKKNITCSLASGEDFVLLLQDYTIDKNGYSVSLPTGVTVYTDKQTDIFSAAEAGYMIEEAEVEGGYSYTAVKVEVAAPIVFHDGGTYEEALTVPMIAQVGAEIYYSTDGTNFTKYTQPLEISTTTTVTAYAMLLGAKSSEVTKTFTIVAKQAGPSVTDGYYNIKAGDKYVNVAGRKTVTLVDDNEGMPGTVIRVKATNGKVETLRSQGVDVPSYAQKAMNYVPEIVRLAVDKLDAEGAGNLLGEHGLEALKQKFDESFDYNLYLEGENNTYRIYGKTPSMKPVVDFYAENKDNVDAKLPQLEQFINQAIDKVLEKTGGRGAGILVDFDLETVWQKMGSTLTKPTDEASTAKFYEEVLTSEANVWNFAYQTAMIYWGNLKNNDTFKNNLDKLGDYAKYIDKVENIQPNFKYYIVPSESGVDFISEGNVAITDASTAWTMEPVSEFKANFDVELNHTVYSTNGGVQDEYKEYYTTLYTDFAYTVPDGVKAYKVKEISDKGVAVREEITGTIPAQTPVMLVSSNEGAQALTLSTEDGAAVTGNLLVGADELINQYQLKTSQVESLFNLAKDVIGESAYNEYLSKYEHLMLTNAGTVNNKYFFGLSAEDVEKCVVKNENNEQDCVIRSLSTGDEKIGFYNNWTAGANQAFLISSLNPVKLWLVGDVNRDGDITVTDVTYLVNIILGKATYPKDKDMYDFEAADVDGDETISIADVTKLVNMILGKE